MTKSKARTKVPSKDWKVFFFFFFLDNQKAFSYNNNNIIIVLKQMYMGGGAVEERIQPWLNKLKLIKYPFWQLIRSMIDILK